MAKEPKSNKHEIPKSLGACADALYSTRQTRLTEQKDIKVLEDYEKRLKEHIIAELPKSESSGISGKLANARVLTDEIPVVEDWEALYKFILKKKRFDLLQRRLNETAVQEMWENGEKVPGIGTFSVVKVSVTKL